jgi:cold shock CspA family protein
MMSESAPLLGKIHSGRVRCFDEDAGLGEIDADDGGSYSFHTTAIVDGSRTIAAGTKVHFLVFLAARGSIEATEVTTR